MLMDLVLVVIPLDNYSYGWKCKCGSEMEMNIIKLNYIPECLLCGDRMAMMYSINPNGEIWMNKAVLLQEEYE